jgi:hypothetical protein
MLHIECDYARNIDPTAEAPQRIDINKKTGWGEVMFRAKPDPTQKRIHRTINEMRPFTAGSRLEEILHANSPSLLDAIRHTANLEG